jgi:hypothetical protein
VNDKVPRVQRCTAAAQLNRFAPSRPFALTAIAALCAAIASRDIAQDLSPRPSLSEIQAVEAKVRMPRGAAALRKYFRYYYLTARAEGRSISGVYIAEGWFRSSEMPVGRVIVVSGVADVPDVEDGGCGVVYVEYDSRRAAVVSASCSAEVITERGR